SRFELSADLGPSLQPLRHARRDQQAFAEVARELAHTLAGRIAAVEEREGRRSGARERRAAPSLPLVFDIAEDLFAAAAEDAGGSSTSPAVTGRGRRGSTGNRPSPRWSGRRACAAAGPPSPPKRHVDRCRWLPSSPACTVSSKRRRTFTS